MSAGYGPSVTMATFQRRKIAASRVQRREVSQATGWQQHSVRGFLAGTVKRKLGFALTSSKPDDGIRRYRIEKRRGR